MPHAELKFSNDLNIDHKAILSDIEASILKHDAGAGICKGRAYPCDRYLHTHLLVEVSILPKAHRDDAFCKALLSDLEAAIKARIEQSCAFSLELSFSGAYYVTNEHQVAE